MIQVSDAMNIATASPSDPAFVYINLTGRSETPSQKRREDLALL